jgi:hypothetical protein
MLLLGLAQLDDAFARERRGDPGETCLTDTSETDWETGVSTFIDLYGDPGNLRLFRLGHIGPQNASVASSFTISTSDWVAQTFQATANGNLVSAQIRLYCFACTGTTPGLTVALRATTGSPAVPTGPDLATATITGFSSSTPTDYSASFGVPPAVTAGATYAIVVRPNADPSFGQYFYPCSCSAPDSNPYALGHRAVSADSGGAWTADTTSGGRDLAFTLFTDTGHAAAGNLESSSKDANPPAGFNPIWNTLSWNADVPANTTLAYRIAASHSAGGPFDFVGPDGSAATTFTASGASLAQFNGKRYLKYQALLTTSNSALTPSVHDVSVCYSNADCTAAPTITPTPTPVCANSTGNTASGPAGMSTYAWSITNGTITSATNIQTITYSAGASGNVGLTLNTVDATCPRSGSINVLINAQPNATISAPASVVTATAASASVANAGVGAEYVWLIDNGSFIGNGDTANVDFIAGAPGTTTLDVLVETAAGCSASGTASVSVVADAVFQNSFE